MPGEKLTSESMKEESSSEKIPSFDFKIEIPKTTESMNSLPSSIVPKTESVVEKQVDLIDEGACELPKENDQIKHEINIGSKET